MYALDAADGHLLWSYDVTDLIGGGRREGYVFRNRGVAYANGVVYTAAGSFLFALDAKTGKPVSTFGKNGQAAVIMDVIRKRFPDVQAAISLGYWFTTAPQVHNGVIYIGSTRSESHIPGGHVLAVNANTGAVLWHFNTIPQDKNDQGWDVAGPTWVGGERNGGGIWETPSIDPELGLIYVAVGNPFGDSTKRAGINLFTNAILALTLDTGRLKWYFQQTHHDVWDYDSGNQPILFDMQVRGRRVKALAEASKNGFLYILNRETGEPVHPINEVPVPTKSERAGEQPWPTQPIPFTASGKMMAPVSPVTATDIPAERLATYAAVPMFTPLGRNQIQTPGQGGGANYGPLAYSPRTGYLYVNAIDDPNNSGRAGERLLFGVRPHERRARVAESLRRLRTGGTCRDSQRSRVRRKRKQHRRLLHGVRREVWRAAVEIQHGRRSVFLAVHVYGQWRTVCCRGIGRRRPRPQGRRLDSQLRAAAPLARALKKRRPERRTQNVERRNTPAFCV